MPLETAEHFPKSGTSLVIRLAVPQEPVPKDAGLYQVQLHDLYPMVCVDFPSSK